MHIDDKKDHLTCIYDIKNGIHMNADISYI